MTDLRLAIWDVDGTLVDSRETIHNVMVEAFRQSGLVPPEYDDTRRIVGLSLHEACAQLAPMVGPNFEEPECIWCCCQPGFV